MAIRQWNNQSAGMAHKTNTKQLIILQNTNTKHFSTQINSLKRFERRVGGQARAQAVDIDDLVGSKASYIVKIKENKELRYKS